MTKDTVIVFTDEAPASNSSNGISDTARMVEILGLINDPNQAVSDINRLVAGELASVTKEMTELSQTNGYRIKFLSERIKALRELSKTLAESEALSKKDILNFDVRKQGRL